MGFEWRPATPEDLDFARKLTCENMLRYYIQHDLLWLDEAFDVAWAGRENRMIVRDDAVLGFVSLSRDASALYIRELHIARSVSGAGRGFLGDRSGIRTRVQGTTSGVTPDRF